MENKSIKIKELFVRLSHGEVEAYDALFHDYYSPLVMFSNSFINDRVSAEDIVSDIFCKLWIDRAKYRDVEYGQSYLFRSVKNSSLDFIRNRNKIIKENIDENIKMELDENDIFEVELYTRLKEIISQLPTKCSDILKLKLDGLSDKEISEKIGVKFETVRSHQKRGFTLIRNRVDNNYTIFLFI